MRASLIGAEKVELGIGLTLVPLIATRPTA
jgi:hypothetical protein